MNYPLWDIPAGGLFIAAIAILHVFVSHFAVGGGLFLVLTERRARRDDDAALLDYVRRHSRFFILVTLVFGAVTGVGIWFIIGLVHPSATSSLIQLFVWFWAIEWTFFIVEIAAALVYYYGWDRLTPAVHVRVGWIYAISAWMSLVVINGILTFMLTPGDWIASGDIWDAFFNPTYWPALVARTAAAIGLAGLYALLTASWMPDGTLKRQLAQLAGVRWVLPMAIALPLSLAWYLWAAGQAGVDVAGVFGMADGRAPGVAGAFGDAFRAVALGATSGYPVARLAALAAAASGVGLVLILVVGVLRRPASFGPMTVAPMMLLGLVTFGGTEFVREVLRKPYVLAQTMFVNGVRLGPASDPFAIEQLNAKGVLASANYVRPQNAHLAADDTIGRLEADGEAVARLLCASCHTRDGYLALRPLVTGRSVGALENTIAKLAVAVDGDGRPSAWTTPHVRLRTWRGRQMPPFAGTDAERHALAVYLAMLGGATREQVVAEATSSDAGRAYVDDNCAMCHGADAEWPFAGRRARTADAFYEMLGRLPEINDVMPPFEGDEALRRAVASHLAGLTATGASSEVK